MSPSGAKKTRTPLSDYTTGQLQDRAFELRDLARTARLDADIRALEVLAGRFEELAASRDSEDRVASFAPWSDLPTDEEPPPCPDVPAGEDFAAAWEMACRHVRKGYILPETIRHPVVMSECYRMACMMVAYGITADTEPLPPRWAGHRTPTASTTGTSRACSHNVIVVDDVADVLVSMGAFLKNAGFGVRKAANGDEALRAIASDASIDVLVTDFAMPGLNGADLIAQAVQIRPSLKALVITGYPNVDGLSDLPAGITVLAKPFRRDALVAAVESLVGTGSDQNLTASVFERVAE